MYFRLGINMWESILRLITVMRVIGARYSIIIWMAWTTGVSVWDLHSEYMDRSLIHKLIFAAYISAVLALCFADSNPHTDRRSDRTATRSFWLQKLWYKRLLCRLFRYIARCSIDFAVIHSQQDQKTNNFVLTGFLHRIKEGYSKSFNSDEGVSKLKWHSKKL